MKNSATQINFQLDGQQPQLYKNIQKQKQSTRIMRRKVKDTVTTKHTRDNTKYKQRITNCNFCFWCIRLKND